MGSVKLQYGTEEHTWAEGDQLNEVTSAGVLSMTTTDNVVINLRQFDTYQDAVSAKDDLWDQIIEGIPVADGNGDVVIVIDDL